MGAVLEYMIRNQGASSNDQVMEMYGSPWIMMVTFLSACVGGADWIAILRPIRAISDLLVPIFIVVMVFVIFGLANLLTTVLTDSVLRDSRTNERHFMSLRWRE